MHTEYLACFTNLFNNQKSVKTVHNSLVLHTIIVINRDGSLRRAKAKIRLDVYATGDGVNRYRTGLTIILLKI